MAWTSSSQTVSTATLWTTLEFVLARALNVLFIAILARILTPEDFGTFALLAIFLGAATALIEGGFGLALIQNQDTTEDDHSTVFWISLGTGTVFALILAATSPFIATFFDLSVLEPLTQIMAITVLISGMGVVQRALLVKRLAFKKLAVINVSALVISSIVAVLLARSGFGVFALAWQGLASALVTLALVWTSDRWIPAFVFSWSSAKRLFGFGGYMLASTLLEVIYSKAYTLLIGKFYGPVELGQFSKAEMTSQMVSGVVVEPISKIAFPAFAQMQGDLVRIRNGLQSAVGFSMLINSAIMLTLAVMSRPFVLTVFGPQWEQAAHFLPVLALGALLMPLHVLNVQALIALGRADLLFVLEVVKKTVGIGILIFSARYGVIGIAWGLVISSMISFIINAWYSGVFFQYGPIQQSVQIIPCLGFGAISAFTAHVAMLQSSSQEQIILLFVGFGASAAVFIFMIGVAWLVGIDLTGMSRHLRRQKGSF